MKFMTVVRTLVSRFLLLLLSIIYAPFMMIALVLPRNWVLDRALYFYLAQFFYAAVVKISFVPVAYKGVEYIPKEPAIFVANHQSSFDIALFGRLVGHQPHVWFALKSLLKSPVLRFLIPQFSVLVDMSSPMSGMRSLREIIKLLAHKPHHCMVFPEGGRYADGKIHDFYPGFGILARKMNRPVVPVYMHGVQKVYPPDAFFIHSHPVTVTVGKPFFIQDDETEQKFRDRVRVWFCEQAK